MHEGTLYKYSKVATSESGGIVPVKDCAGASWKHEQNIYEKSPKKSIECRRGETYISKEIKTGIA